MSRCKDLWCRKQHAACVRGEPLGAHPPSRFTLVGGPLPYLTVSDDTEGNSARYCLDNRRMLRELGKALLRVSKPRARRKAKGAKP